MAEPPSPSSDELQQLRKENERLKKLVVDLQANAEIEEEFISNKLLKRIDELKAEKQRLLIQVEREEEYLTNALQRQLEQAQKEKIMLEATFEKEQEGVVNKLRKEIAKLSTTRERSHSDPHDLKLVKELRRRITILEGENKSLKLDLETEKGKTKMLQGQIDSLKATNVEIQSSAEQQEEYISNTLLKRISNLKKEKESLLVQVETEEEYLTNSLNKKVSQLLEEKQALEAALKSGQSTMVDHLQKRLDVVRSNSPVTQSEYVRPGDLANPTALLAAVERLEDANNELQIKLQAGEERQRGLQQQIKNLKNENLLLMQRHQWEIEKLESIEHERVKLEKDLEITEERQFNMIGEPYLESRSRSHSTPNDYMRRSPSSSSSNLASTSPTTSPTQSPALSPQPWWTRKSSNRSSDNEAGP